MTVIATSKGKSFSFFKKNTGSTLSLALSRSLSEALVREGALVPSSHPVHSDVARQGRREGLVAAAGIQASNMSALLAALGLRGQRPTKGEAAA